MNRNPATRHSAAAALLLTVVLVSGCSNDMADLQSYIDDVKARGGGRIESLPQIKPYETYTYQVSGKRSPFFPVQQIAPSGQPTGPQPIENRNKEYLEQFPLDSLEMVGTLVKEGQTFALVQTKDTLVHRVRTGDYVGQNDGRIVAVSESEISIEELVADGIGGFFNRSAAIGLSN